MRILILYVCCILSTQIKRYEADGKMDISQWYMDMMDRGAFEGALNSAQLKVKQSIENIMRKKSTRSKKLIDSSILAIYESMFDLDNIVDETELSEEEDDERDEENNNEEEKKDQGSVEERQGSVVERQMGEKEMEERERHEEERHGEKEEIKENHINILKNSQAEMKSKGNTIGKVKNVTTKERNQSKASQTFQTDDNITVSINVTDRQQQSNHSGNILGKIKSSGNNHSLKKDNAIKLSTDHLSKTCFNIHSSYLDVFYSYSNRYTERNYFSPQKSLIRKSKWPEWFPVSTSHITAGSKSHPKPRKYKEKNKVGRNLKRNIYRSCQMKSECSLWCWYLFEFEQCIPGFNWLWNNSTQNTTVPAKWVPFNRKQTFNNNMKEISLKGKQYGEKAMPIKNAEKTGKVENKKNKTTILKNEKNEQKTNPEGIKKYSGKINSPSLDGINQNKSTQGRIKPTLDVVQQDKNKIDVVQQDNNKIDVVQQDNNKMEVQQDNNKIDVVQQDNNKIDVVQQDNNKIDVVQQDNNKMEVQQDNNKIDVVQQDNNKMEVVQQDNNKIDVVQQDNNKIDVVQQDNNKIDVFQQDNNKIDVVQQDNNKMEVVQQDNNKIDVVQQDNNKIDVVQQDNNKIDVVQQDNNKIDVVQQDNNKMEVVQQDNNKIDVVQQDNNKIDVFQQDNNKIDVVQQDNNKIDVVQEDNNKIDVVQQDNNKMDVVQQDNNKVDVVQQDNNKVDVVQQDNNKIDVVQQDNNKIDVVQQDNNKIDVVQQDNNKVDVVQQDNNKMEVVQQDNNKIDVVQQDNNKIDVIQQDNNTVDVVQQDNNNMEVVQQDNNTMDIVQQDNNKIDVVQQDNTKIDVVQQDNNKIDVVQQDNNKIDVVQQDNNKMDVVQQDNIKVDVVQQDNNKVDAVQQDNNKVDVVQQDNNKVDVVQQDNNKVDVVQQDNTKIDVVQQDNNKIDVVQQDNNKIDVVQQDNNKMDVVQQGNNKMEVVQQDNNKMNAVQQDNNKIDVVQEKNKKMGVVQEKNNKMDVVQQDNNKVDVVQQDNNKMEVVQQDNNKMNAVQQDNNKIDVVQEKNKKMGVVQEKNNKMDVVQQNNNKIDVVHQDTNKMEDGEEFSESSFNQMRPISPGIEEMDKIKILKRKSNKNNDLNVDKVTKIINEKAKEHLIKIQSLELAIIKLENKLLTEQLNKNNDTSSISRLENQILRLENELMRINQTYTVLRQENDQLKRGQRKYLELSQNSNSYCNASKTSNQTNLIAQQEVKISELTHQFKTQSESVVKFKIRLEQTEEQNRMLYQIVMNQSLLIAQVMKKIQVLTDQVQQELHQENSKGIGMSPQELMEQLEYLVSNKRKEVNGRIKDGRESKAHSQYAGKQWRLLKKYSHNKTNTQQSRLRHLYFARLSKTCFQYDSVNNQNMEVLTVSSRKSGLSSRKTVIVAKKGSKGYQERNIVEKENFGKNIIEKKRPKSNRIQEKEKEPKEPNVSQNVQSKEKDRSEQTPKTSESKKTSNRRDVEEQSAKKQVNSDVKTSVRTTDKLNSSIEKNNIKTNIKNDKVTKSEKEGTGQLQERKGPLYVDVNHKEPKDCHDLYLKGITKNGAHRIKPVGTKKFLDVFCDMKNGGWTVIQRRQGGTISFFRDWNMYKKGFGGVYGEHWLGNDIIHHLTNQNHYRLHVELTDWEKKKVFAKYDYFMIDDESEGYRLHIEGFSGDSGDSLSKHNLNKFSTKDVDNDRITKQFGGNCAKRFSGAWWYYKCYASNLNGIFYRKGMVPEKKFDGIAWKSWKGPNYSLMKTEMKIIPVNGNKEK